jgi:hypothetical protein
MSTISAGNTTTTSIVVTGDTTGNLTLAPLAGKQVILTTQLQYADGTTANTAATSTTNASVLTSGTLATARLPTGTVLQVVSYSLNSAFSTTSGTSSPAATGLTASITPASTSNKILVRVSCTAWNSNYSLSNCYLFLTRNGTYLNAVSAGGNYFTIADGANGRDGTYVTELLDTPANTSACAYSVLLACDAGSGGTSWFNTVYGYGGSPSSQATISTMVLMEIAG